MKFLYCFQENIQLMHFRRSVLIHVVISFTLLFGEVNVFGQCVAPISTFPYSEDFETGSGSWFSGGIANDWVLGIPQKPTINSAGNGTRCWLSGGLLNSFYNYGERSWVQSPCFDFRSLNYPVVSFKIFWETENQYDGGNLQYSLDGGTSWQTVGYFQEPDNCVNQNWYTIRSVTNLGSFANPSAGWSGTIQSTSGSCRGGNGSGQWLDAIHCVSELSGEASVIFRFTMGSGTTCNDYDGIGFDLFRIDESVPLPFTVDYTCLGMNQIQFIEDNALCHDQWFWDFGDPGSPDNTSFITSPIHVFSGPGIYTVTMNAGSECIPGSNSTIQVEILTTSVLTNYVTCADGNDGTAEVTVNNPPIGLTYTWNTNPVQTTAIADSLSTGNYTVTISGPDICPVAATADVVYGPDAFPIVNLGPDTVICPGFSITLYAGSFSTYEWQDGTQDSTLAINSGGNVSVRISNSVGCETSDTLLIEEDCLGDILFPNCFTPNDDGMNESFYAVGNLISSYELNIFNRWGQIVFTAVDIMDAWDGTRNGVPQQEGVYVFLAEYSIRGSEVKTKTGRISLLR